MTQPIDLYFDFSSTYSYVAHQKIIALAKKHDLSLNWKSISLGAVFHQLGHSLPQMGSPKQKYLWHDVERSAREAGLDFSWPDPFPFNSIHAARGFWWIKDTAPEKIEPYVMAVFHAAFAEGIDAGNPENLKKIVCGLKLDGEAFLAALGDEAYKDRLKQETAAAQAREVFGAPTFFFKDEMFWGADRLPSLESFILAEKEK